MRYLVAIVLSLSLSLGLIAQAEAGVQLGFALDGSGSVGSTNWNTIRTGLANALSAVVPIDSSVEITVVKFGSTAYDVVLPTLIDSPATLAGVTGTIAGSSYPGGTTNMSGAINLLTTRITGSSLFLDPDFDQIYDIVTDGQPNSDSATITAINNAIGLGVDEIDFEAIGSGVDMTFLLSAARPQPGTIAPPFTPGFVLPVANFDDFPDAIESKIRFVVNPVPEPSTLIIWSLLGALSITLGSWRRRNQTS